MSNSFGTTMRPPERRGGTPTRRSAATTFTSAARLGHSSTALSAAILLIFFVLDVLFLRAMGVAERVPWLVLIYLTAGIPMVGLGFSSPGEPWYALARDMLGFLQSPLPSVMVVLVPWFLARMNATDQVA